MVRSRKPLLTVTPFIVDNYYAPIQPCVILADTRWNSTSPDPQLKVSTTSHRRTNKRERMSEQRANILPLLTPRAIARGACGHSPFYYCRNTTAAWIATHGFPCLLSTEW